MTQTLQRVGRTEYSVRLAWRGLPTQSIPVQFADQASQIFCAVRDQNGFGASDMKRGCGDLLDATGNVIGRISYNGRIWDSHNLPIDGNTIAEWIARR